MKSFALIVALIFISNCSGEKKPSTGETDNKPVEGQDYVCGMKGKFTIKAIYEDKSFGFCSDACKKKFEQKPAWYKWGYCICPEIMPKCKCDHCGGKPEACPCSEEMEKDKK